MEDFMLNFTLGFIPGISLNNIEVGTEIQVNVIKECKDILPCVHTLKNKRVFYNFILSCLIRMLLKCTVFTVDPLS